MASPTPKYIVKAFLQEQNHHILVHWEGYNDPEDFTWEPKKNLKEDLQGSFMKFYLEMKQRVKKKSSNEFPPKIEEDQKQESTKEENKKDITEQAGGKKEARLDAKKAEIKKKWRDIPFLKIATSEESTEPCPKRQRKANPKYENTERN